MKKNGHMEYFNYEKRIRKKNGGTEDNLIIYHLKQETFTCSIDTSDKTEDIF